MKSLADCLLGSGLPEADVEFLTRELESKIKSTRPIRDYRLKDPLSPAVVTAVSPVIKSYISHVESKQADIYSRVKKKGEQAASIGSVYIDKLGRKPFINPREIKRGRRNKGKIEITLTAGRDKDGNIKPGKKKIVEKKDIKQWPGGIDITEAENAKKTGKGAGKGRREKGTEGKKKRPARGAEKDSGVEAGEVAKTKEDISITGKKDKTVSVEMTKAKEDSLSPKEQKKYLIAEIDKAIEAAPEGEFVRPNIWRWADNEKVVEETSKVFSEAKDKYGTVTIEVPGDGEFTVINSKGYLREFKKRAKRFPVTDKVRLKSVVAKPKRSNKRFSGEGIEYYNEFSPRKEKISTKGEKAFYKDGYFSDGAITIKTKTKPKVGKRTKYSDVAPDFKAILKDIAKNLSPAKIVGEFLSPDYSDTTLVHVVSGEGKHYQYQATYVDQILTAYPKAKIYVSPSGFLTFKNGNVYVGAIAPFGKIGDITNLLETAQQGYNAKQAKSPLKETQKGKIEDFGEKLGGARKDTALSFTKEITDDEIKSQPLSKIWPKKEIDSIEDTFIAALATTARAEIPNKPRVSYKLKQWVAAVKMLRDLPRMAGEYDREEILKRIKDNPSIKDIASKIQLLEIIDRKHWGRIGRVSEAPDAYSFDKDGRKVSSPFSQIYIDKRYLSFKTGDILDHVDKINERLATVSKPKTAMKFQVRGTEAKGYFINKKGDPEYRALKHFQDMKEAFKYLRENKAELADAWEAIKERDNVKEKDLRRAENRPRRGKDYRNGKDATPDMFENVFGFRGVEFGNWVSQGKNKKERQGMLNFAYDAFMDLANIIKIPPEAISLNGSLGLGFGSRGRGWASAHYEPDTLVINLTKTRGAGALAHEWFHALDNYFQRKRGAGKGRENNFITYKPEPIYKNDAGETIPAKMFNYIRDPETRAKWKRVKLVRPEVEKSFSDLVETLNKSPMAKRSAKIDKGKRGYWSRIIERAARSFENYVIEKMMEGGYHNDYLANVVSEKEFVRDISRYPYLMADEVAPVAEAFDNLFSTFKTKKTKKGTALYQVQAFHGGRDVKGKFSTKYIGTGEGAQVFGWGLYFTDLENIAKHYADEGSKFRARLIIDGKDVTPEDNSVLSWIDIWKKSDVDYVKRAVAGVIKDFEKNISIGFTGDKPTLALFKKINSMVDDGTFWDRTELKKSRNLYKVTIHKGKKPGEYVWLDWYDAPTLDQMRMIFSQIDKENVALLPRSDYELMREDVDAGKLPDDFPSTYSIYEDLAQTLGSDKAASLFLLRAGIDGIRYPAGSLSGAKTDAKNYVVFDENAVTIEEHIKYQLSESLRKINTNDLLKHPRLKSATFTRTKGGDLRVTFKNGNGFVIRQVKEIKPDSTVLEVGYKQKQLKPGQQIGAEYDFDNQTITLSRYANKYTIDHELMHFMEESGLLSNGEIAVINKRIRKDGGTPGVESRAFWLQAAFENRDQQSTIIQKILRSIADFIDTIINAFGKTTARGILRNIEKGKIQSRFGKNVKTIFNKGTFDAGNPDIRYQIAEAEKSIGTNTSLDEYFGKEKKKLSTQIQDITKTIATDKFWDKAKTQMFDRLHPIKANLGDLAYKLARNETGTQSIIAMFLRHGKLKYDPSGVLTSNERNKGFLSFIQSVGKDWDVFLKWVAARRAQNLEKEDRERWITEDVRKKIYKEAGADLKTGAHAKFEKYNKILQGFNNNILDIAQQAGLISAKARKEWAQEFYIPFYRLFEDKESRKELLTAPYKSKKFVTSGIRRLMGADAKIGDLQENMMRNWFHLIHESQRNIARFAAVDFALTHRQDSIIEEVKKVPGKDIWFVMRPDEKGKIRRKFLKKSEFDKALSYQKAGRPQYFLVHDPDLFNALSGINLKHFDNFVARAFGSAKRLLTYSATFGPAFRVANLLRDTMHTSLIEKSFTPFIDSWTGFWKSMKEDQDFIKFAASGFAFGSSYVNADDPKSAAKFLKRISKKEGEGALSRIIDTPKKALDIWEKIGAASENAARVQLYSKLRKQGESHLEAAFRARDLLDFTMRGESSVVSLLIQTVPFLNARMQGLYKLGSVVADKETRNNLVFRGMIMSLATLALWSLHKDDDEYKELEDWDKFSYYHFWIGDKHYRIPKPFEVGAVFSSFPVAFADVINKTNDGKHIMDFIGFALNSVFSIDVPQLVKPAVEQWANKSFFTGRPIVSRSLEGLPAGDQADPWTSELAKLAGKLGISPKRAEHLVRSYFSVIGMGVLSGTDYIMQNTMNIPEDPTTTIGDWPLFGRFIKRKGPARYTRYQTWFYETMKEMDSITRAVNEYKRTGQIQKAQEYTQEHIKKIRARKQFLKARRRLSNIRKRIKTIYSSNMSPSEKRKLIDRLSKRRNEIVKKMYEFMRQPTDKKAVNNWNARARKEGRFGDIIS